MNVSGLLDNIAWVLLHEKRVVLQRKNVGLFLAATQAHLADELVEEVRSERIAKWQKEYAKNYRDALVHRIPLYVPSAGIRESDKAEYLSLGSKIEAAAVEGRYDDMIKYQHAQERLGRSAPLFAHSALDDDAPPTMVLHSQMIADTKTVLRILEVAFPLLRGSVKRNPE